jgi:RHS repeat-associated protein
MRSTQIPPCRDRARGVKSASRQKSNSRGRCVFVSAAQVRDASQESSFDYDERASGLCQDAETQLNYNYFRDYDPGTGRYVQSDPIGVAGGINGYAYVGGDPVGLVDPRGLAGGPPAAGTYYPRGEIPQPPRVSTNRENAATMDAASQAADQITDSGKQFYYRDPEVVSVCKQLVCPNPNYFEPSTTQCTPGNPTGKSTPKNNSGPFLTTPGGSGMAGCQCLEWGLEFR